MLRIISIFILAGLPVINTIAQDTTRLTLLFTGDIMQHDSQIRDAWDATAARYDYTSSFQYIKPYLSSPDLTIGNLELTLAGPPYKGYPQFSAPDELAVTLKDVGFDVLVTANNHSLDRRKKGLERTIRMLDSLGIRHTGTFVDTTNRMNDYPLILEEKGIRLALLNYTYGTNGIPVTKPNIINLIDTAVIRKDLEKAIADSAEVRIVLMHWGLEYEQQPSREQKILAKFCFDHGATLVIGSHPHVIQPMEWNKESDQVLVYSLGNFVSGQRPRYRDGGAMIQVELQKAGNVVSVVNAEYMLQWVYRTADARQKYYILPVDDTDWQADGVIADKVSSAAYETFKTDSRSFLTKYNRGVVERGDW